MYSLGIAPIPFELLNENIMINVLEDNNTYREPKEIKNVHIQIRTKVVNSASYGQSREQLHNIYIDGKQSEGWFEDDFRLGSTIISRGGQKVTIVGVDVHNPYNKIHHIKVVAK